VNRGSDAAVIDPDVEDVLKVYLGDVTLRVGSLAQAIGDLSGVSGVRIEFDPESPAFGNRPAAYLRPDGPPAAPLVLESASLGTALATVLGQFNEAFGPGWTYQGRDGAIFVRPVEYSGDKDRAVVRAYDVGDLIGAHMSDPADEVPAIYVFGHRQYSADRVVQTIWDVVPLPGGEMTMLTHGDYLVVRSPQRHQRDVQRSLLMLRNAETRGAR
jgi:hypothetical protein